MIEVDLRTQLLRVLPLRDLLATQQENRLAQDHPRQEWFDRLFGIYTLRGTDNEDTTDAPIGSAPFRQYWDVEFWSPVVGEAERARLALQTLHLYRGPLGNGTVQGIFATDHASDYTPRQDFSDLGLHLAAVDLEIVGYLPGD